MIPERNDDIAVKEQPFPFAGIGDIGKLVVRDVQCSRKDLAVSGSLIEHINKIRVFKDIFNLSGREQILYVLSNARRDAAVFAESFPDLNAVRRRLLFFEKQVKFV